MPLTREPSAEEFEAAGAERSQRGARAIVLRTLWRLVALLIVVAMLAYFIVPFNGFFGSAPFHRWRLNNPMRTIPLAPQPASPPKLGMTASGPGA
jgi:hypothetical protein